MSALQNAIAHAREIAIIRSVGATIGWDERTYIPEAAGPYRAEQMTYMSGLLHQRETDAAYGEWLNEAADEAKSLDPQSDEAHGIRVLQRNFTKATKLPQALVEADAKNSAEGQQAWVRARKHNDFELLRPFLQRTVELKREWAQALGFEECMYDALLDEFEPQEKTSRVRALFASLRTGLVTLLQEIVASGKTVDTNVLTRAYPVEQQREIGMLAASQFGFDFDQGRLDVTNHPFCTTLGPQDVRLTTRYDEDFFSSAFFGTLHEAGHGIYEQGLRNDWFELPPGQACSMAIHESQSRLWENAVGRSRSFWQFFYPEVQKRFSSATDGCDVDAFYAAVNQVRPSLIRVEADEVTYNLHIIIRFELEQELIDGGLGVADLPAAWNAKYADFLGITPPNDSDGVLQDVHWGAGAMGYFPTYALGNLYAAQFLQQAEEDLGGLDEKFRRGEFLSLREWLRDKIHVRGKCDSASELVGNVTGKSLTEVPLLNQLRKKFSEIYQL